MKVLEKVKAVWEMAASLHDDVLPDAKVCYERTARGSSAHLDSSVRVVACA